MGSMPYQAPMMCVDCEVYFWAGFILAMVIAIVLSLAVRHILK